MSGYLGDRHILIKLINFYYFKLKRLGRRIPLIYGALLMGIFGILSGISINITMFIIMIGIFGIMMGILTPIGCTNVFLKKK